MIIFLVSSHILMQNHKDYEECQTSLQELKKEVIKKKKDTEEIDWERLKNINKDIVGWIKIYNTNINYPILQDSEELYYLNHTYKKNYNRNGSIFTLNENLLKDNETIIYGHNMNNKIMFSDLQKYMYKAFFDNHQKFYIYTEKNIFEAMVFSCYSINESEEKENIKNLEFYEEIEYYKNKSKFKVNDIGEINKIVKLSTCSYLNATTTPTNERYYIIARIVEMKK